MEKAIDWDALMAPFPEEEWEWRIQQSGTKQDGTLWVLVVPFIQNRAIMNRLDEVVGPENWQNYFMVEEDGNIICAISIRVDGEWIPKYDGASQTDVESFKGGLSGAMKRAAVQWGIGRHLYELEAGFADIHENGKYRAKTKEGKVFKWDPPKLSDIQRRKDNGRPGEGGKDGSTSPSEPSPGPSEKEPEMNEAERKFWESWNELDRKEKCHYLATLISQNPDLPTKLDRKDYPGMVKQIQGLSDRQLSTFALRVADYLGQQTPISEEETNGSPDNQG